MNEASIADYIVREFADVAVVEAMNAKFFMFDPERKFPFATIVTTDEHDQFSNLDRPDAYRLNVGVGKETFQSLFGDAAGPYEFTAEDRLLPHPVYGKMYWICVVNPSDATFEQLQPLLAEAYEREVKRVTKA